MQSGYWLFQKQGKKPARVIHTAGRIEFVGATTA
jgi:hypothetical protein